MENYYIFQGYVQSIDFKNNTITLKYKRPVIHERHVFKRNEVLHITCLDCAKAISNVKVGDMIEVHGCIDGNENENYFVIERFIKYEEV